MNITKNKRVVMVIGIVALVIIAFMVFKLQKSKNDE